MSCGKNRNLFIVPVDQYWGAYIYATEQWHVHAVEPGIVGLDPHCAVAGDEIANTIEQKTHATTWTENFSAAS